MLGQVWSVMLKQHHSDEGSGGQRAVLGSDLLHESQIHFSSARNHFPLCPPSPQAKVMLRVDVKETGILKKKHCWCTELNVLPSCYGLRVYHQEHGGRGKYLVFAVV